MFIDVSVIVDWLHAKAASDYASEQVLEAKQSRYQADERLYDREMRLLDQLGIEKDAASVVFSKNGQAIDIRLQEDSITIYLDGQVKPWNARSMRPKPYGPCKQCQC